MSIVKTKVPPISGKKLDTLINKIIDEQDIHLTKADSNRGDTTPLNNSIYLEAHTDDDILNIILTIGLMMTYNHQ